MVIMSGFRVERFIQHSRHGTAFERLAGLGALFTILFASHFAQAAEPVAHATIYLAEPILSEGGAIIVVGRPVSEARWRRIKSAPNPARSDVDNPKAAEVRAGDRHFGATVTSPVTYVEIVYPERGSYTFNLRPISSEAGDGTDDLQTERILIGSADMVHDPDGGFIDWPTLSVIAVVGSERGTGFAYLANATAMVALADEPAVARFEGIRTLSLSEDQIERYVRE